jgi:hypothetical protein
MLTETGWPRLHIFSRNVVSIICEHQLSDWMKHSNLRQMLFIDFCESIFWVLKLLLQVVVVDSSVLRWRLERRYDPWNMDNGCILTQWRSQIHQLR